MTTLLTLPKILGTEKATLRSGRKHPNALDSPTGVIKTPPRGGPGASLAVLPTVTGVPRSSGQVAKLITLPTEDDVLGRVVSTHGRKRLRPNMTLDSSESESEVDSGATKYARLESLGGCTPTTDRGRVERAQELRVEIEV